jgi:hypothetical protein
MSYTLSGIRNRVIDDKLDDTSYDTAIVDRFINDTQRSIFNTYELPFMEKVFSGTLPSGERSFQFPDDVQLIQSATITGPDGTQRNIMDRFLDFRTFNRLYPTPANNTEGPIAFWTSHNNKMYTSAPIDQAYTLEIFYIKKATELADGNDVPEIPEEFEEVLVLGAYMRVLKRNEDFDLAADIKNDYNDQLDLMVSRLGYRLSNGPIVMKQPRRSLGRRSR